MRRRLCGVLVILLAAPVATAAEAPWDDQMKEMGYWILNISAINVINSLNLSRDQAAALRDLAKRLEAAGPKPCIAKGKLYGDFQKVRETYQELRQVVMAGQEVPKDLQDRVAAARGMESKIIRASLTVPPEPGDTGECSRCHAPPSRFEKELAAGNIVDVPSSRPDFFASPDAGKKTTDWAHLKGTLVDMKGIMTMARLAHQVDATLTEPQKEIVDNFACCLVPPAELSDPVRAGQAEASAKDLGFLRRVRKVPAGVWPRVKPVWLNYLDRLMDMKLPGRSAAQKQADMERMGALFEKVRAASDTEFEMNKVAYCKELKGKKGPEADERKRRFKFAYFLLTPGISDVYGALIKRMDKQRK
ncbi:MAG: hypothetical protein GXP25_14810 [Planctomycetes bacterium]|nr:hypothetical protein [Planctomycetota bacterium]